MSGILPQPPYLERLEKEHAQKCVEQERLEKENAQKRADKLAAQLAALGIEPDKL